MIFSILYKTKRLNIVTEMETVGGKSTNRYKTIEFIAVFELGLKQFHSLALVFTKLGASYLKPFPLLALELTQHNVC